nr:hypothetical protein [Tanacetum cinerariifolium]
MMDISEKVVGANVVSNVQTTYNKAMPVSIKMTFNPNIYVDDIIFGSTKKELCNAFERLMHEKFQMSSMGELTFCVFTEVKTASIPMETQKPLLKDEDGEEVDVHMYRSMIGSLMYLTSTRPDIMFAVCTCARYQVNLKVSHLHAMKMIFTYLKGQPKLGLLYPKGSHFDLVAYTESDYARASLDRKSTTGVLVYCQGQNYQWRSTDTCLSRWQGNITESFVRRDLQLADEEGIDCLPNSIIFEQLALMGINNDLEAITTNARRLHYVLLGTVLFDYNFGPSCFYLVSFMKPKRKDTQVPQPSGPTEFVEDEDVHKELGDSLVRAATTASSLEAELDSGGTPRCQETMRDTTAQTRFESESKHYNDSLLTRGCSVCYCPVANTLISTVICTSAIGSASYMGLISASSSCASFPDLLLVSCSFDYVLLLSVSTKLASNALLVSTFSSVVCICLSFT